MKQNIEKFGERSTTRAMKGVRLEMGALTRGTEEGSTTNQTTQN
tara:strand:- start:2548 stop:2679 length:132 start_codon:yes stop_codon:yes gene_type:complete